MLASRLAQEGKLDKAANVLKKVEEVIPASSVPHSYTSGSLEMARIWNSIGNKEKASDIAYAIASKASEYIEWYMSLPNKMLLLCEKECFTYLYQMHSALGIMESAGSNKTAELAKQLNLYNQMLQSRLYGSVGMDDAEQAEEEEEVTEDSTL
jgi:ATP/maltotriose-dependent transcriptional regulator MalT